MSLAVALDAADSESPVEVRIYAAITVAQAQMQDGRFEEARETLENLQAQGLSLDTAAGVDFCLYYSLVLRSGKPEAGRIAKSLSTLR